QHESGSGYRAPAERGLTLFQRKPLISDRNVNVRLRRLHQLRPALPSGCRMTKTYHIAIVGATGAVGAELLRVIERRHFAVASLRAVGSARSIGKSVRF